MFDFSRFIQFVKTSSFFSSFVKPFVKPLLSLLGRWWAAGKSLRRELLTADSPNHSETPHATTSPVLVRVKTASQTAIRRLETAANAAVCRLLIALTALVVALPVTLPAAIRTHLERLQRSLTTHQHQTAQLQAIVAQGSNLQLTEAPAESRIMHTITRATRIGTVGLLAGIAVAILWWSRPFGDQQPQAIALSADAQSGLQLAADPRPANQLDEPTATPTVTAAAMPGLAIINPANVQGDRNTPDSPTDPILPTPPALVTVGDRFAAATPVVDTASADTPAVETNAQALVAPEEAAADAAGLNGEEPVLQVAAAGITKSILASLLVPTPTFEPVPTINPPVAKLNGEIEFIVPGRTVTPTPTLTPTPTPVPVFVTPGRLWSNFQPRSAQESDHFWIDRPFPDFVGGQIASPSYQFGSTAGNRYRVHHGMDISNPSGTPVRAAVEGEVVHAGWDDPDILGPYGGFYGNAVVIRLDRRLPVAGGELDVFVLYGHLSEALAEKGQRVTPDDLIGRVGMTGIAIGPHLHVEVRLGANTYQHSVNPYLWVTPIGQTGAVAIRLLTADGRTWAGARVSLARYEGNRAVWARQIETYMDTENIGPDPAWGENGAMDSVPPGRYYVIAQVNGETVRTEIDVQAGQTTFVELRTQQ